MGSEGCDLGRPSIIITDQHRSNIVTKTMGYRWLATNISSAPPLRVGKVQWVVTKTRILFPFGNQYPYHWVPPFCHVGRGAAPVSVFTDGTGPSCAALSGADPAQARTNRGLVSSGRPACLHRVCVQTRTTAAPVRKEGMKKCRRCRDPDFNFHAGHWIVGTVIARCFGSWQVGG